LFALCYNTSVKDKSFWIQLLVSAGIPTFLGAGTIFVFSQFKERLPSWAYDTLLIIFYIFFIVMLAIFALMLIRLAFGESFNKLWELLRKRAKRRTIQRRLKKWIDRFAELIDLVHEVADDFKATKLQEDKYFDLHLWFTLERSNILSLWYSFEYKRTKPAKVSSALSERDLEWIVFYKNYQDPFSVFYEPMTLGFLGHSLRSWDRSEINYVLRKLYELTLEFNVWTLARYD